MGGCGCTSARKRGGIAEEIQAHDSELQEERQRLQDRDCKFESVEEQLRSASDEGHAAGGSSVALRAELRSQEEEHAIEVVRHRDLLQRRHTEEFQTVLQENDASLRDALSTQQQLVQSEVVVEEQAAAEAQRARVRSIAESAEAEAERHRAEAEAAEKESRRLREELHSLRAEHGHAVDNWQTARRGLEVECEKHRAADAGDVSRLDQQLVAAREEHSRAQLRFTGMEKHMRNQIRSLQNEVHSRKQELQQRGLSVQQRERELLEVHTELADLQPLFDEVNHKLQSECGRVDKLQDAVQFCAKQSKELESLQAMLEDSHQMLGQVRDALEHERAERVRTAGLLEHEQQRTRLLLDVLRHFKEKLQGLTPQVLLNRLGCVDQKASFGAAPMLDLGASGGPYSVGTGTSSTVPSPGPKRMADFDLGFLTEQAASPSGPPRMN